MFNIFNKKELTFDDLSPIEKIRARRVVIDEYESELIRRNDALQRHLSEAGHQKAMLQKELAMYKSLISNLNLHIKEK